LLKSLPGVGEIPVATNVEQDRAAGSKIEFVGLEI
jgi:hypothetical protein